jgi:hypothetical protein
MAVTHLGLSGASREKPRDNTLAVFPYTVWKPLSSFLRTPYTGRRFLDSACQWYGTLLLVFGHYKLMYTVYPARSIAESDTARIGAGFGHYHRRQPKRQINICQSGAYPVSYNYSYQLAGGRSISEWAFVPGPSIQILQRSI